MTGEVVARGTRFPLRATGRVYSTHDRAINVAVDGRDDLTALIIDPADMTVASLCIRPTTACRSGILPSVARGESVSIGATRIQIGNAPIDLTGTPPSPFTGEIARAGAVVARRISATLPALLSAIAAEGAGAGFTPIAAAIARTDAFAKPLSDGGPFAAAAWDALGQAGRPCRAVPAGLIGLGEGFTPSGDDFVVGFLATRRLLGADGPGADSASNAATVRDRLSTTTRPGASLLLHAIDGCFPTYLCTFAASFAELLAESEAEASGIATRVRGIVAAAATHGASSGLDALTGFAYALMTEL